LLELRLDEGEGAVTRDAAGGREARIEAPTWIRNAQRAALRFDGKQTYIELPSDESLQRLEAFTLALWFRVEREPGPGIAGLIVKSPTFRLLVYPGAGKFLIDTNGAGGRIYETPEAPVRLDAWHHVALAYSADAGAALYLDGQRVFAAEGVGAPVPSGEPLRIGLGTIPEQQRFFPGLIANVKLFDRALTGEQVAQIMTQEQPELAATFRGPEDLMPDTDTDVLWDIGDRKQLFIDERFIESSKGVTLTMNLPTKLGPVLLPDQPWESKRIGFCDSVIDYEGQLRLYYWAFAEDGGNYICMATSEDGLHWERPKLGVVEFQGSKENNIVLTGTNETTVFLDPHGKPEERFKTLSVMHWPDAERAGLYVHTSPDGIHWTKSDRRVFPLAPDTANQAAWDQQRGKYVAYIRIWSPLRKVGRVEMSDITEPWPYDETVDHYYIWGEDNIPVPSKEIPTAFGYDEHDPVVSDHYNPAAVEYPWAEASYFMFPSAYMHFPEPPVGKYGNDGLLDIQMAVSRHGVKFHRLTRAPYVPLSREPDKDSKSLYMAIGMLRRGDDILQYYAGYEVTHGLPDAEADLPMGSICAARQRLDGFISADADYAGGEILTPPLRFAGERLELNIDCSAMGACRVALLDEQGEPYPGFSAALCDEIIGNHVHKPVTWEGRSDVSALAGQVVRLHFVMRACKLYAFGFGRA
jgi:hypothetical protein